MGKVYAITAVLVFATASWVCAGNFEVLADAAAIGPPTQQSMIPGTVVKAQFTSNLKATSDMELDADSLLEEQGSTQKAPQVRPSPAVAYKDKRKGAMAPPPRLTPKPTIGYGKRAEAKDEESIDLEADLEKDLVISPPPVKPEDTVEMQTRPAGKKPAVERKATTEKKAQKKAVPSVKRVAPQDHGQYAISQRPIQKVRPVTQGGWSVPAGAHVTRVCPPGRDCAAMPNPGAHAKYQPMTPQYMNSQPRATLSQLPPMPERFVRDGVTVKLAPAAAQPSYMEAPEESANSDILSTAAEILGMPFAFISSFF
jgi:hypothetical protein